MPTMKRPKVEAPVRIADTFTHQGNRMVVMISLPYQKSCRVSVSIEKLSMSLRPMVFRGTFPSRFGSGNSSLFEGLFRLSLYTANKPLEAPPSVRL